MRTVTSPKVRMVRNRLALVTYLTDDYDRAIAWFRDALGFVLLEDTDMGSKHGEVKRWVRMAPPMTGGPKPPF